MQAALHFLQQNATNRRRIGRQEQARSAVLEVPMSDDAGPEFFEKSKPANNQCMISSGYVWWGKKEVTFTATTVTLGGAVEWVFAKFVKGNDVGSILHAAVLPTSDATYQIIPLEYFTVTAGVYDEGRKVPRTLVFGSPI